MVAPRTDLQTLFSDDFESGVLDDWVALGNPVPPSTLQVGLVNPHAGLFALDVIEPVASGLGWGAHSLSNTIEYIALDGWIKPVQQILGEWQELRLVDSAGNAISLQSSAFGNGGCFVNGVQKVAYAVPNNIYHEFRFELNSVTGALRAWLDNVDQGNVVGITFGPEIVSVRAGCNSNIANAVEGYFDDIQVLGLEIPLWRRRRKTPRWP